MEHPLAAKVSAGASRTSRRIASIAAAMLCGCATSAITPVANHPEMPANFAQGGTPGSVELNWLERFDDPRLTALVAEAIEQNYALAQERALLAQAEQEVIIAGANRIPNLDVSLGASRRGFNDSGGNGVTVNTFDAGVDMRWDIDLWGRLSKTQQAARLSYAAGLARLNAAERDLAIATASAVFRVLEAQQLLQVAQRRLDNAVQSHDIVASGYRQGLNDALDLYLARNQMERQQANLVQQQQLLTEAVADLQLAVARYPDGRMQINGDLPIVSEPVPVGLPSELLTRRPDLQEAWLNLLAADARLAAAHKARFPSLSLVANGGVASGEFASLLDSDSGSWSLLGNLSQTLFAGGRLAALEQQAAQRVQQSEQQYLGLVYNAFAEVETSISRSASLSNRYVSFQEAEKNAHAALNLALEQYQRGLVAYTTVLESQRQAFDAEVTVVQLRNLLLQNRLSLYKALGGDFSAAY
jgi:NodT family efflux transporter outer membrane factor (OMF) lipoprotein